MRHPLDRPVSSDRSYEVFQARRLRAELGACALDSQNLRLHGIPSAVVQREAFIGDREVALDTRQRQLNQLRHGD